MKTPSSITNTSPGILQENKANGLQKLKDLSIFRRSPAFPQRPCFSSAFFSFLQLPSLQNSKENYVWFHMLVHQSRKGLQTFPSVPNPSFQFLPSVPNPRKPQQFSHCSKDNRPEVNLPNTKCELSPGRRRGTLAGSGATSGLFIPVEFLPLLTYPGSQRE